MSGRVCQTGLTVQADVVKYFRISDSTYDDNMDDNLQFPEHCRPAEVDKIDLSVDRCKPEAWRATRRFSSSGSAGFSPAWRRGEAGCSSVAHTLVMVDNDGDATAEMVILVHGATGLAAGDFIL